MVGVEPTRQSPVLKHFECSLIRPLEYICIFNFVARNFPQGVISSATPSTSWVMLLMLISKNLSRKKERKVGEKPNINLKYREQDGMMLPDLQISNSSEADQPLGRYGRMALEYLRENHPERFTTLKMDGSLMEIMHRVQDEATEKIEALTQQMLQQEPLPQTEDIMERTRHLNSLKLMAEETVLQSVVLIPR